MEEHSTDPVVLVTELTRAFGKKVALDAVSLTVPKGHVLGLVGENGAGKTTLVKHLLGALKAKSGEVRVFGLDPVYDPPAVLSRIGYLSEDRDLPNWMRVGEFLRYTQAFFPDWDEAYAERLREQFGLASDAKIRQLSRGEQAKTGLLTALAHRPDLLLLDEPSSGLDPAARQHILAAVVRSVAEEGRTVLFSSHLLDEVERVADDVVMLVAGKVILNDTIDEIKATHHRYIVRFEDPRQDFPDIAGLIHAQGEGVEWQILCHGDPQALEPSIQTIGARIMETTTPSFEAIFLARLAAAKNTEVPA